MKKYLLLILLSLFSLVVIAQTKPSAGDGSKEKPYKIGNAQELLWFAGVVNGTLTDVPKDTLSCAELTADIDLSSVCGEEIGSWNPIGFSGNSYSGTFDGKGYGIKNLYATGTSTLVGLGLFGNIKSATISDLSMLSGSIISSGSNIGSIAGTVYMSTIINCHNYIPISGGRFAGGVVGYASKSSIVKCHNEVNIKSYSNNGCGGICGCNYGSEVSYCYNVADIVCEAGRVGGIVGSLEFYGIIHHCFSIGSVTGSAQGGIYGYAETGMSSESKDNYFNSTTGRESTFTRFKKMDAFANGEVCYLLNAGSEVPVFFQSIGVDKYPVLNGNEVVVKDEDKYYNVSLSICEHGDSTYVDPTCTSYGLLYCTKCHKLFDTVPPISHDTTIEVTKPTCTALGYSTVKCDRCGLKLYDYDTVPVLGHDTTIDVTKPTCTALGYSTAKCDRCGLKLYNCDTVPALGHDTTIEVTKPTCTKVGYSTSKCSRCGLKHYNCDTVPAISHDTTIVETKPTCTKVGYSTAKCSVCGLKHYNYDTVPALGHDTTIEVTKPTCTKVGYSTAKCNVCGSKLYNYDTVPALGHDVIDTTIHPTCSSYGYDIKKCTRCNATWGEYNYTDPTMNHNYDGDVCSVCGHQRIEEPELRDGFYLISNARELLWFEESVNAGFSNINGRLIADIDLSEVCGKNIANWRPIGKRNSYTGIFDGDGHKVLNLYHYSDDYRIGFFNNVGSKGIIKNLWVSGYLRGESELSGICVSCSGKIDGCVSEVSISAVEFHYMSSSGGICSRRYDRPVITNCLNLGSMSRGCIMGGIVPFKSNATVCNCIDNQYLVQCLYGSDYSLRSENKGPGYVVKNNYVIDSRNEENYVTANGEYSPEELCTKLNTEGINWGLMDIDGVKTVVPKSFASKIIYPVGPLSCPLSLDYKSYSDKESKIEYLYPNHIDADNDGVYDCCGMYHSDLLTPNSDGVYEICSAEQFKDFADAVSNGFKTMNVVKLTCDIDLSDYCSEKIGSWKPISRFEGIFDGQHHKISGLYVDGHYYSGLFSVNNGVIKNVAIAKDCRVKGETAGAICAENMGLIENCSNEANVEGNMAGGIAGDQRDYHSGFYIKNCYNTGDISGKFVGGIAGICNSELDFCHSYGHIDRQSSEYDSDRYIGGVSGLSMVEDGGFFGCLYAIETGWVPENVHVYDFTTSVEQFASGEVCYALNKGQDSTVWYQTLNVDPYPVLDPTHGKVLYDEEKGVYYNYPDIIYTAVDQKENEKEPVSLVAFAVNRQVIVVGVDSFRIVDMLGHDVTAQNGSLANGVYIVVFDNRVAKVIIK